MRGAGLVALLILLAGVVITVVGVNAPPLSRSCAEEMAPAACESAVGAVLRRGLPELHPLILSTYVAPGPASGPQDFGHRATVEFRLLGMPGTTVIELFYDSGAHWGGESDRSDEEIQAWSLVPLIVGGILAAVVGSMGWIRRSRPID